MPTRRIILQSAAALSAAPFAPRAVLAGGSGKSARMDVISDERYREAREFRQRAARWDGPALRMPDGDITAIWQSRLSAAWKRGHAALAGLTERPALFMLEHLGWQHGLRVVFQAEHEPLADGTWAHTILRSSLPGLGRELEAAGSSWPTGLADRLLTAPREVVSSDVRPTGAAMSAQLDEPAKLHSWIIAPRPAPNGL